MCKVKVIFTAIAFLLIGSVSADHLSGHTIENRLKPSGSVYVEGDDVPVSKPAVVASSGGARTGEEIYNASCVGCHATDAIGAPMFGNADSWKDRIAKGEDALFNSAINGFNAMPPMGTCGSCSQDDIKATVKYMVANSQ